MCGFEAFINGKHIVGQVKEKEQAHREYREAISKGHGAYLMDEESPVSDVGTVCCRRPNYRTRLGQNSLFIMPIYYTTLF